MSDELEKIKELNSIIEQLNKENNILLMDSGEWQHLYEKKADILGEVCIENEELHEELASYKEGHEQWKDMNEELQGDIDELNEENETLKEENIKLNEELAPLKKENEIYKFLSDQKN